MLPRPLRLALLVVGCALLGAGSLANAHPPGRWLVPRNPWFYPPLHPGYPQFPNYQPYPFPIWDADPFGAYLKGAAELTRAQGDYFKSVQEAYLLAEQVKAAQIETRRKEQEQWLWEQQNLPSPAQDRERAQREELRRALTAAPQTEIWSGSALNTILAELQDLRGKGYEGPRVALDAATLALVNVTPGKAPANPALLRQVGRLDWPAVLRTLPPDAQTRALRMQVDALLVEARRQALLGRVDARLARELAANTQSLLELLQRQVGEFSFSQYAEGRRFLRQLGDAAILLQQPDAPNYFNGRYTAQGGSVRELVLTMSDSGLRFAPAASGDEAAYTALYRALVEYYQGIKAVTIDR